MVGRVPLVCGLQTPQQTLPPSLLPNSLKQPNFWSFESDNSPIQCPTSLAFTKAKLEKIECRGRRGQKQMGDQSRNADLMGVISSLKISGKEPGSHLTQHRPLSPFPHDPPPLAAPFLRLVRLRAGPSAVGLLRPRLHARRRCLDEKRDPIDASAVMRAQSRRFPPFLVGGRGVCPGITLVDYPLRHKSPRGSGNGPCLHS